MDIEELAKTENGQKVLRIIEDLADRKGLGNMWDEIDDEIKREIFETWVGILDENVEGVQM